MTDNINHPPHYRSNAKCTQCAAPIECIDITQHLGFLRGNAIKYLWRADSKGSTLDDLAKARWYIDREIASITTELTPWRNHS